MIEEKKAKIRVRFAPAPTGLLHIGSARTALFNYLFAKRHRGVFILRLEDTDRERSKVSFERDILENLQWLGIRWDEGPANNNKGYLGRHGPYRQSERGPFYEKYLEKLLAQEKAYYCFCPQEELKSQRDYQMSQGQPPRYSGKCRQLKKREVEKRLGEGSAALVRFKVPAQKVAFQDLIRGRVEFDTALLGDFSLAKKKGEEIIPLYNFAASCDDFEMKISHVIRGEDHISNTPKQILVQEALGFPRPEYAHLPLILGPDKSKLSKRHGAIAVAAYKRAGYLPEALLNFIVFLGWNPGDEREIFSLPALIKEFSLARVQKAGAVFNLKKLDFLNGYYIRRQPLDKLTEACLPYLTEAGLLEPVSKTDQHPPAYGPSLLLLYRIPETKEAVSIDDLQKIIGLYQERLKKLSEISSLTDFFFKTKLEYDRGLLCWKQMSLGAVARSLNILIKIVEGEEGKAWELENIKAVILKEAEKMGNRGELLWPLRVALTGKDASAPPFEVAEILGRAKTLERLKEALEKISS